MLVRSWQICGCPWWNEKEIEVGIGGAGQLCELFFFFFFFLLLLLLLLLLPLLPLLLLCCWVCVDAPPFPHFGLRARFLWVRKNVISRSRAILWECQDMEGIPNRCRNDRFTITVNLFDAEIRHECVNSTNRHESVSGGWKNRKGKIETNGQRQKLRRVRDAG